MFYDIFSINSCLSNYLINIDNNFFDYTDLLFFFSFKSKTSSNVQKTNFIPLYLKKYSNSCINHDYYMICAPCETRKHFECIDCMNNHKTHLCSCDCHDENTPAHEVGTTH